jgi:hypothetical protein
VTIDVILGIKRIVWVHFEHNTPQLNLLQSSGVRENIALLRVVSITRLSRNRFSFTFNDETKSATRGDIVSTLRGKATNITWRRSSAQSIHGLNVASGKPKKM